MLADKWDSVTADYLQRAICIITNQVDHLADVLM